MKVVKPQRLALLTRSSTTGRGRYRLAIAAMACAPIRSTRQLEMETALWAHAGEHVLGGILDEGHPKPSCEVIVHGSAFAPNGEPARAVRTRLILRRNHRAVLDKSIVAVGDRFWNGNEPTEPVPFVELPLDWTHAFGGEGFDRNPVGKGSAPIETEHGPATPLPNLENPARPIVSDHDRPDPLGYGPVDLSWPQRQQYAGKEYGQEWLETRFPAPAVDFDPRFFQTALPDQWLAQPLSGDETVVLEGMHPEGQLEGTLSPLVVKGFVTRMVDGEEVFSEHQLSLETLHLLPTVGRVISIYRASIDVAEDDADDIVHLMLAAEDPDEPKSLEHYRDVLAGRLDKERGAMLALKDEDLMPPAARGWTCKPDYGDMAEHTRMDPRVLVRAERGRRAKMAEARAELEAAGYEVPDDFEGPEPVGHVDPFDIDGLIALNEKMDREAREWELRAEREKEQAEQEARAAFEEAGFDYDAEMAKAMAEAGGPPDFSADQHLMMLHDMAHISSMGGMPLEELEHDLMNPDYEASLRELEERVKQSYRDFAHVMPAAAMPAEDLAERLRVIVVAAHDSGESLAGRNLIGANLAGLKLRGLDLSGAILEHANLSGAELVECNLAGAVLCRADLTQSVLCNSNLRGANLGGTRLVQTDLSEADLGDAVFMRSELSKVTLHGANLNGADFLEATLDWVTFIGATLEGVMFHEVDLRTCDFTAGSLKHASLLSCDLRGVDFAHADLERTNMIACTGRGASFVGAKLTGAAFVHGSTFEAAFFDTADLTDANFLACDLTGSRFTGATMTKANLMKAALDGSDLSRIDARGALLIRTKLAGADLRGARLLESIAQKADLRGADLTGSNLARSDISLAHIDEATRLDEALLLDTRVDPKRPQESR